MEDQPQVKRKRRPSVRLGEIGFLGPYDASERRMQPLWKKPARLLSLENVGDKAVVVVEECSVDEAAVISVDEEKVVDGVGPSRTLAKQLQHLKLRVGQSARKPEVHNLQRKTQEPRDLTWNGNRVRRKHGDSSQPRSLVVADSLEEGKDEAEEEMSLPLQVDDEARFLAGMSSDSVRLMGSESKGAEEVLPAEDSGIGPSDHSEEGDGGSNLNSPCESGGVVAKHQKCIIIIPANPHSNGDEIQGAIDDGPRQAAAKGSSTVKQYEGDLRLGRQAARRSNSNTDIVCRDHNRDIMSRDTAGELSGRFQASPSAAKGAIVAAPSYIQRVTSLSAGVSEWLLDLGLGKYSELFTLNEVDTEVLPLLTMGDLREMGVDAVGARRKMFTHIQELGQLR